MPKCILDRIRSKMLLKDASKSYSAAARTRNKNTREQFEQFQNTLLYWTRRYCPRVPERGTGLIDISLACSSGIGIEFCGLWGCIGSFFAPESTSEVSPVLRRVSPILHFG